MIDSALDDSVACVTLPFPGVDGARPPRRIAAPRRIPSRKNRGAEERGEREASLAEIAVAAQSSSRFDRWFVSRLPQHGPKLDGHAFRFPAADSDLFAWDWRCSTDDVCSFLLVRDEDGPARDPGTAQLLGWFQSEANDRLEPCERLWALKEFLYRFEPGRRWQALSADLDPRSRRLSMAWIGAFEGIVWNELQTLRAVVPTPGSLADDAMPDPMTLRIDWTGRIALGVGVVRGDLSAFRRDDPAPLPFQVHRTTACR